MWKIINNIVTTKSTSSSKINGVFDLHGKFVDEPKIADNLMNKNVVYIAYGNRYKRENEWRS